MNLKYKVLKGALISIGLLSFSSTAFAGIGGSVVPDYPSTVSVGQTGVAATLTITNGSTAANAGENVSVSNITHTPSCGSTSNPATCQPADVDLGVFTVHNGTGELGTACAGIAFTASAPDATGKVTFTPSSAVTLGPATGTPALAQCIIDFTVDVLKVPTKDSSVSAGMQTDQLGSASFLGETSKINGSGTGSTETTVNKASPTVATTPDPTSGNVGVTLNDTATVSGGATPTGSVTFSLFSPADATCVGTPAYTNTDPSSPYATSPGFVSNASGIWHWMAVYNGDANNNPATSTCDAEAVTLSKASPTIATTLSTTTANVGTSVHDSSVISSATSDAGGSVTYTVYANNTCSLGAQDAGTKTVTNGIVPDSNPITFNSPGDFYWQAVYSGDAKNNGATSTCADEHLAIATHPSTIVGISAGSPLITAGASTTLTVTEKNDGDVNLTDAHVVVDGGVGTLSAPPTSGDDGDGILEPGETWSWTVHVSPATTTTYTATGHGLDPQDNDITYPGDPQERASVTVEVQQVNLQYCSPGYWKQPQHFDSWKGLLPSDKFSSVFGRTITIQWSSKGKPGPLTNPTLLQALQAKGGGINLIAREAVDALENSETLQFGFTPAQVIAAVQAAIDQNNPSLLDQFNLAENCPLN